MNLSKNISKIAVDLTHYSNMFEGGVKFTCQNNKLYMIKNEEGHEVNTNSTREYFESIASLLSFDSTKFDDVIQIINNIK